VSCGDIQCVDCRFGRDRSRRGRIPVRINVYVEELERAVLRAQRARLGGRATNSAEPLEYDGLEYAALPVRLNFIAV